MCASGFRKYSNARWFSWVNSLCQRNSSIWIGQDEPTSSSQHLQNRRPSQISNTIGKWPVGEAVSTTKLYFDLGDNTFAKHFVVKKKITESIVGLLFMRYNSVVSDTTHGLIFPQLVVQVKSSASEQNAKRQSVLIGDTQTKPFLTTKAFTAFADHPSESNATGTVTPLENFTKTASLLTFR